MPEGTRTPGQPLQKAGLEPTQSLEGLGILLLGCLK